MASPKASGRMIRKSVSESKGIGSLSAEAAVLFFMLIPHYNPHGKIMAGPGYIKDEVVPYRDDLSYENLPQYLQEISDKTNVKWFKLNGKLWLHSLNFLTEHQDLRVDKLGEDKLPSWTPPDIDSTECEASPEVVPDFPSRAEGLKVEGFKKEERTKQQQQQHAGEQLKAVVEEHQEDLKRLFPDVVLDVAIAKLLAHFQEKPLLVDPWLTVIKWFQREFAHPTALPPPRASPVSRREQQTREILAANAVACRDFCQGGGSNAG